MAYAEFSFYQITYHGTLIPDADSFQTAAERASDYLDSVTFGRLLNGIPDDLHDRVQRCCCALADAWQTCILQKNVMLNLSGSKTAESVGKYSVSYGNPTDTFAALLSGDTSGFADYCKSICMRYLGTTGLLFRGCC